MATKNFCDICENEIKGSEGFRLWNFPMKYFCNKCWFDKNKWPKIHSKKIIKK